MSIEKVDLVIIGAGPAGLAAAAEAARRKANVVVLDESPIPGGRLPGQIHPLPWRKRAGRSRWSNGAEKAAQLADGGPKSGGQNFLRRFGLGDFFGLVCRPDAYGADRRAENAACRH